jgi:hypothetical protein
VRRAICAVTSCPEHTMPKCASGMVLNNRGVESGGEVTTARTASTAPGNSARTPSPCSSRCGHRVRRLLGRQCPLGARQFGVRNLFVVVHEPRVVNHVGANIADNLRSTRLDGMRANPTHRIPYDGSTTVTKRALTGHPPGDVDPIAYAA